MKLCSLHVLVWINMIYILVVVYSFAAVRILILTGQWTRWLKIWKRLFIENEIYSPPWTDIYIYTLMVTRYIARRSMPTGKLPAKKKKFRNGNQYLTRTTGPWVKNPNVSEASFKPKQSSYIIKKLFFCGDISWTSINIPTDV